MKVTTLALSYLRTIDAEHMPYLLKFLLLSATPMNIQRIISRIREQLKNFGASNLSMTQHNKLKGKSVGNNVDGSILDALRSSLRFKNVSLFTTHLHLAIVISYNCSCFTYITLCATPTDAMPRDFERTERPQ